MPNCNEEVGDDNAETDDDDNDCTRTAQEKSFADKKHTRWKRSITMWDSFCTTITMMMSMTMRGSFRTSITMWTASSETSP